MLSRLNQPSRVRLLGRLVLATSVTVLMLFLSEAVVRVAVPQQLVLVRRDIWQPDDNLGWRRAGNLDTTVNTGERAVRLITDRDGNRIGAEGHQREAEAVKILALGDSFVAALQVEYEQTLTALLERGLSQRLGRAVEVVNSAVAGYGPSHYLIKAKSELSKQRYDLVLVFLFLGNDVEERRIERFAPKESIERRFRLPRKLARAEILDAAGFPTDDFLEAHSQLFILTKNRLWPLLMRLGLSARGFPDVLLRSESKASRWQVTASICAELAAVAKQRGVPVRFVLLPSVLQIQPELARVYARSVGVDWAEVDLDQVSDRLSDELESLGLEVIDTTSVLRRSADAGAPTHGAIDTHFNPTGHAVVAESLLPVLTRLLELSEHSSGGSQ